MKTPFDERASEYETYRPGYPHEFYEFIVQHASLGPGARVADAGAGTGKSSAPFLDGGFEVTAVEASLAMIRQGTAARKQLQFVCCAPEQIGLRSEAFDLVMAAQSLHWFDVPRVLAEFWHLLHPGGCLAVFWNTRDPASAHVQRFEELIQRFNPELDRLRLQRDWPALIASGGLFVVRAYRRFSFVQPMSPSTWVGLARSLPYVGSMSAEQQPRFEQALGRMLVQHASIDCPYFTDLWLAERLRKVNIRLAGCQEPRLQPSV